jgi:hypothetical protein
MGKRINQTLASLALATGLFFNTFTSAEEGNLEKNLKTEKSEKQSDSRSEEKLERRYLDLMNKFWGNLDKYAEASPNNKGVVEDIKQDSRQVYLKVQERDKFPKGSLQYGLLDLEARQMHLVICLRMSMLPGYNLLDAGNKQDKSDSPKK